MYNKDIQKSTNFILCQIEFPAKLCKFNYSTNWSQKRTCIELGIKNYLKMVHAKPVVSVTIFKNTKNVHKQFLSLKKKHLKLNNLYPVLVKTLV